MSVGRGNTHTPRIVLSIDNLGSGGAQRQAVELAVYLRAQREIDVRILTYQDIDARRDRGLHRDRLQAAGVPVSLVAKRGKVDPTLPPRMASWLKRSSATVVHAFMASPALWSLLAVRLVGRTRPALIAAERSALANSTGFARTIQGVVYRHCDAVTVNSRSALEELASELQIPRDRLHYVPNGIDVDAWDRAASRPCPWPLDPGCFHAALIGRFGAEKNHRLLLDALQQLGPEEGHRWRVWFVGASTGGPGVREGLDEEIRRRGLVHIVRAVPPTPDIAALMSHLDLLVLPSLYEGFPNVVLEAMASRLLVAAAPVGDVPSLLRDGETGISFSTGDAASLARALSRSRSLSSNKRAAIVQRARALIEERYSIAAVAEDCLRIYTSLSSRSRAASPGRTAA